MRYARVNHELPLQHKTAQAIGSSQITHLTLLAVRDRTMEINCIHRPEDYWARISWMDAWSAFGHIFPRMGQCANIVPPFDSTQGLVEALAPLCTSVSVRDGDVIYSHCVPLVSWWCGPDNWFPFVTVTTMTISVALLWCVLGISASLKLHTLKTLTVVTSSVIELLHVVIDEASLKRDPIPGKHMSPVQLHKDRPHPAHITAALDISLSYDRSPTLFSSYGKHWCRPCMTHLPTPRTLLFVARVSRLAERAAKQAAAASAAPCVSTPPKPAAPPTNPRVHHHPARLILSSLSSLKTKRTPAVSLRITGIDTMASGNIVVTDGLTSEDFLPHADKIAGACQWHANPCEGLPSDKELLDETVNYNSHKYEWARMPRWLGLPADVQREREREKFSIFNDRKQVTIQNQDGWEGQATT
ncbi:hypothetical protein EXIGLDRAFT_707036 [Exidia glandulosa HHB12029]|uniref:Uncharacterized protein n=1 Tax=Exidia glandulosa HHB12029 TaxID=1314781 RepID=A0A165Z574_EXIGL|nr:hypothetical protein EXIGLDRAFT_707036 [Exidia glandulosa HHB12029]